MKNQLKVIHGKNFSNQIQNRLSFHKKVLKRLLEFHLRIALQHLALQLTHICVLSLKIDKKNYFRRIKLKSLNILAI